MINVNMRLDEQRPNILIIEVDLAADHGPSGSGKSVIVASTQGNVPVPGESGVMIGVNVYKPLGRGKRQEG